MACRLLFLSFSHFYLGRSSSHLSLPFATSNVAGLSAPASTALLLLLHIPHLPRKTLPTHRSPLAATFTSSSQSFVVRKRGFNSAKIRSFPTAMAAAFDRPPLGYRANVGICLVNHNNEVFVASRLDVPGAWQMPQGGVNDEEDPRQAAARELKEETGMTSVEIIAEVPGWLTYDFPPSVKTKLTELWGKEWNGQAQKWFLFRFHGNEDEINLEGDGEEAAEFSDYKWLPFEEVVKCAVDFKRPVYERVFETFSPILNSKV